jgi:hypothetical protein
MIKLSKKERIEQFWDWFNAHRYYYEDFESQWDPGWELLWEQLSAIDEKAPLRVLIGMHENGNHRLIISVDGAIDYFRLVREIVEAAPEIIGWKVKALQDPQKSEMIHFENLKFKPAKMYCMPIIDDDFFGVMIYAKRLRNKKLSDEDSFYLATQILIDIIGEFHYATKVAAVVLQDLSLAADEESLIPLADIYKFVENNFMNRN